MNQKLTNDSEARLPPVVPLLHQCTCSKYLLNCNSGYVIGNEINHLYRQFAESISYTVQTNMSYIFKELSSMRV